MAFVSYFTRFVKGFTAFVRKLQGFGSDLQGLRVEFQRVRSVAIFDSAIGGVHYDSANFAFDR